LAGWGKLTAISVSSAMPLMLIISAATTVLVGLIGRHGFGFGVGIVAAAFYALHPLNIAYDPYVLPDGLAVCFEAAFLLMVTLHVKDGRMGRLIWAGVLAGLMFGTKSYFVLVGAPIGLMMLFERGARFPLRIRKASFMVAGLLLGAAASFVFQAISTGDPFAEFHANSGYSERILARGDVLSGKTGVAALVYLSIERLQYLVDLFLEGAGLLGWLFLAGLLWGVQRAVTQSVERALVSVAGIMLLFLIAMPVSLSPLVLVEMQSRYLTAVLAPLAVLSAALCVHVFAGLSDVRLRTTLVGVLALGLAWCAWMPAAWWDRYGVLQTMGIRAAGGQCATQGTVQLMVSRDWKGMYAEELSGSDVAVSYGDFSADSDGHKTLSWLRENPQRCVFLLRAPLRTVRSAFEKGGASADLELGHSANVAHALASAGIEGQEVYVPEDTLRVWLDRLGMNVRGQLVGWLYRTP
jgi:hypothetical protein